MAGIPANYYTYKDQAAAAASKYGVPQSLFFGLIQQESGWNPAAYNGGNSNGTNDYGLGQINNRTAAKLGINRYDVNSNLNGSAQILAANYKATGDWTDALSMYNTGKSASASSVGASYASKVTGLASSLFGYTAGDSASQQQPGFTAPSTDASGVTSQPNIAASQGGLFGDFFGNLFGDAAFPNGGSASTSPAASAGAAAGAGAPAPGTTATAADGGIGAALSSMVTLLQSLMDPEWWRGKLVGLVVLAAALVFLVGGGYALIKD